MQKLIIIALLLISSTAYAQDNTKLNIAVIDFKAQAPVSAAEAAFVTEFFRSELVQAKVFSVIEKENMDTILAEQGFQQTGCTSSDCAVKMGKVLNTKQMVIGKFGKIEDTYIITISLVDVETAEIVYSDNQKSKSIENINDDVARIVDRIVDNIGGKNTKRKTTKERLLREHIDIQRRMTHRKNKFSVQFGYLALEDSDHDLFRGLDLALFWSPVDYWRFSLRTAYKSVSGYRKIEWSHGLDFKGDMYNTSFNISYISKSVMDISNDFLRILIGKRNFEPGVGIPILWRISLYANAGIGISHPDGGLYSWFNGPLVENAGTYLYSEYSGGIIFNLSKHWNLYAIYEFSCYNTDTFIQALRQGISGWPHSEYLMTGIEYTF